MKSFTSCKAIVIERPRQVSVREIHLTEPRGDAIIARTEFSAISAGTDMKTYLGLQPAETVYYPLVPGYENVGRVLEVRDPESALKPGDRVMINECRQFGDVCAAWGGGTGVSIKDSFTAGAPSDYMVRIPDNVSDRDAVLAYLPCVSLKGIRKIAPYLKDGHTVAVIGAGMIGLSAIQIVKIMYPHCRVVCIERNEFRRGVASHYADYVFDSATGAAKLAELTNGVKADVVIECSGDQNVVGSLHQYLKDGGWGFDDPPGHIHLQGDYPGRIVLDTYNYWFNKNCSITMSCCLAPTCKEQILQWMSEGKFDTSHLPCETWEVGKAAEAFRHQQEKGADCFKILFDWRNL
ncbi:MAG: zinc-binding dehydrogenase [Victivallales bacterium]|nr:zinc-binding dehydrogenase [Victivallales bacterium]